MKFYSPRERRSVKDERGNLKARDPLVFDLIFKSQRSTFHNHNNSGPLHQAQVESERNEVNKV